MNERKRVLINYRIEHEDAKEIFQKAKEFIGRVKEYLSSNQRD